MGGEHAPISRRPPSSAGSHPSSAVAFVRRDKTGPAVFTPHTLFADNTSPKVHMPRRDNFAWQRPRPDTAVKECMKDCIDREAVKIILSQRARTWRLNNRSARHGWKSAQ
jgi:hypothetical protein